MFPHSGRIDYYIDLWLGCLAQQYEVSHADGYDDYLEGAPAVLFCHRRIFLRE